MRHGLIHAATGMILETSSGGNCREQMKNRAKILSQQTNQVYYVATICQRCERTVALLKEHRGLRVYHLCLKCANLPAYMWDEIDSSQGEYSLTGYAIVRSDAY